MSLIITDCLEKDFFTLIRRYLREGSSNYKAFASVWRKLGFRYIFSGRKRLELEYFTDQALILAKSNTSTMYETEHRICGIYLMYTLFFCQPLKSKVRIRVIEEEWLELNSFVEAIKVECLEAAFCFYKLIKHSAFDYVLKLPVYKLNSTRLTEIELESLKLKKHLEDSRKSCEEIMSSLTFDRAKWKQCETDYNASRSALVELCPHLKDSLKPNLFFLNLWEKLEESLMNEFSFKTAVSINKKEKLIGIKNNKYLQTLIKQSFTPDVKPSIEENKPRIDITNELTELPSLD
jgi:hypothetical protein